MSFNGGEDFDYSAYEVDLANAMDDEMFGDSFGRDRVEDKNDYELLTRETDTSSAQARKGKDIQGIPWDKLHISRQAYRWTRIEQYKNYENVPSSGIDMDK
ncbi:uncharacterized protein LOC110034795, partial [Phalaenopsis equestris]